MGSARGFAGSAGGDPALALAADAALIVGYCRQPIMERSRLRDAVELFALHTRARRGDGGTAAARRPRLDVRTCNSLIAALGTSGELSSAERVLRAMDSGLAAPPNGHTLCLLMCSHAAARLA